MADIKDDRSSRRVLWWSLSSLFILSLYSTLGIAPAVWNHLNGALRGKGLLLQYIFYSIAGCGAVFYIVLIKREKRFSRYLLFALWIAAFFLMKTLEKNPGEKVHMAEYGIFGALLYNALRVDIDKDDRRLYLYGCALCIAAGATDELIQLFLPNRSFTWHDVFVNGLSGSIVFLFMRFNVVEHGARI